MNSFFCRLTPMPEYAATYTLSIIGAGLNLLSDKYFVCYETEASRPHYHFLIYTDLSSETLRARLKRMFFAQIYISGKEIEDQVRAIAYCMKDGTWTQSGIDINTILIAKSVSKKKLKYDDLMEELLKSYDGDDRKLIGGIIDAHVLTNKKIYIQHIRAHALLIKLRSDKYGTHKEYLINKIIDDI